MTAPTPPAAEEKITLKCGVVLPALGAPGKWGISGSGGLWLSIEEHGGGGYTVCSGTVHHRRRTMEEAADLANDVAEELRSALGFDAARAEARRAGIEEEMERAFAAITGIDGIPFAALGPIRRAMGLLPSSPSPASPEEAQIGNAGLVPGTPTIAPTCTAERASEPSPAADGERDRALGALVHGFDAEVRDILGRVCFRCAGIATRLRAHGFKIEFRAEDEQAVTIQWLLTMYAEHGADWRAKADEFLNSDPAVSAAASPSVRT